MEEMILEGLKAKFDEFDLWDIAQYFYRDYKAELELGIFPEIRFAGNTLPSDDCFKTLVAARNAARYKRPDRYEILFDSILIKKLLSVPYSRVVEVIEEISELTGFAEKTVCRWYDGKPEMFLVSKEDAKLLAEYLTQSFGERIRTAVYKEAILLGANEAKRRIEGLRRHVGKYTKEVLSGMYVNTHDVHFLFYPYYTDPVDAIGFLREHFDEETTAHIIVHNPHYLYGYKNKLYHDDPTYHHDRKYISELTEAYKIQLRVAEDIGKLRKTIPLSDGEKLWKGTFVPFYETAKGAGAEYAFCPRLTRILICTVTAFADNGVVIPEEFAGYNAN